MDIHMTKTQLVHNSENLQTLMKTTTVDIFQKLIHLIHMPCFELVELIVKEV